MDNHNYRTCRSTNFVREFDNEENLVMIVHKNSF